jgi:hypothetical protein
MAIFKSKNNKCWQGSGKRGTPTHCWWECRSVKSLWKAVGRFLKKLKIELPYDPVILLLGICSEESKSGYNRNTSTLMFITVQLIIAKLWKQPTHSNIYIYIYIGVLLSHKEE